MGLLLLATRAAVLMFLLAAPAFGCTIRCADGVERSSCKSGGDYDRATHTFYGGAGGRLRGRLRRRLRHCLRSDQRGWLRGRLHGGLGNWLRIALGLLARRGLRGPGFLS